MTMMLFTHRGLEEFLGEDPEVFFTKRKIIYEANKTGFSLSAYKKNRVASDKFHFPFEAEIISSVVKELHERLKASG